MIKIEIRENKFGILLWNSCLRQQYPLNQVESSRSNFTLSFLPKMAIICQQSTLSTIFIDMTWLRLFRKWIKNQRNSVDENVQYWSLVLFYLLLLYVCENAVSVV